MLHSLLKNRRFQSFQEKIVRIKVDTCLLPLLHHVETQGLCVDFQDVFSRFNFDVISSIVLGFDPKCLAIGFPEIACMRAFDEAMEFIFCRHTVPRSFWKLQKWLGVGPEKKIRKGRETMEEKAGDDNGDDHEYDWLTAVMTRKEEGKEVHMNNDKFLRDTTFSLYVGGRDAMTSTLAWFFWLLTTHPNVEARIVEEMKQEKEVRNQVYLHAALCETLRLFPPIPYERKKAIKPDVLPTGHKIESTTMILHSMYAMGRFEETWGEDCLEFKPERWISEKGRIVQVPSYKFLSFNAGPRSCLGKDISFIQMKIVANAILQNYHVQVDEDHVVSLALSIMLMMKHGLKVRITKRG